VNGAGGELFRGARLAGDERRCVRLGDPVEEYIEGLHRGARPDELLEASRFLGHRAQPLHLFAKELVRHGALDATTSAPSQRASSGSRTLRRAA
jgi:hypothetical protein